MDILQFTLIDYLDWAQDPLQDCAGQPVIPSVNFPSLAEDISNLKEVKKTAEEIEQLFVEQGKRFRACGGNLGGKLAVIRKNPENGWGYLKDLILAQ